MHNARRHLQIGRGTHSAPLGGDQRQQIGQGQLFGLIVDLQRADAGRQVDHAMQRAGLEGLHQGMAAKAQHQVQFGGADFQQQVRIAGQSGNQAGIVLADIQHHRRRGPMWERACSR